MLLRNHLDAFLEAAQGDDLEWSLPAFVERQLRAIIPDTGDSGETEVITPCELEPGDPPLRSASYPAQRLCVSLSL